MFRRACSWVSGVSRLEYVTGLNTLPHTSFFTGSVAPIRVIVPHPVRIDAAQQFRLDIGRIAAVYSAQSASHRATHMNKPAPPKATPFEGQPFQAIGKNIEQYRAHDDHGFDAPMVVLAVIGSLLIVSFINSIIGSVVFLRSARAIRPSLQDISSTKQSRSAPNPLTNPKNWHY